MRCASPTLTPTSGFSTSESTTVPQHLGDHYRHAPFPPRPPALRSLAWHIIYSLLLLTLPQQLCTALTHSNSITENKLMYTFRNYYSNFITPIQHHNHHGNQVFTICWKRSFLITTASKNVFTVAYATQIPFPRNQRHCPDLRRRHPGCSSHPLILSQNASVDANQLHFLTLPLRKHSASTLFHTLFYSFMRLANVKKNASEVITISIW